MAASRRFFSLPLPAKRKRAYRGHDSNCGYIGLGMESHAGDRQQPGERDEGASLSVSRRAPDYHGGADRKETFDIGPDLEPGDAGDATAPAAATPWPTAELGEGFRDTMRAYFEACHRLHLRLLRLIALGLGLPRPDVLVSRCDGRHCNLRLLHYPELALPTTAPLSSPSPSNDRGDDDGRVVVRGARHTDFGTLTLVAQDDVGGLRVQPIARDECSRPQALSEESSISNHESRWISVKPVEGALVVNVGDMLQMLTNGRLKATPHQVVSVLKGPISCPGNGEQPPGEPTTIVPERYSIAFFCNANKDTVLAPIPELVKDQGQESPKPEPVTAMEYLTMRLAATIRSA
jgi:isopenicillin N synthase-like dioxygenase